MPAARGGRDAGGGAAAAARDDDAAADDAGAADAADAGAADAAAARLRFGGALEAADADGPRFIGSVNRDKQARTNATNAARCTQRVRTQKCVRTREA